MWEVIELSPLSGETWRDEAVVALGGVHFRVIELSPLFTETWPDEAGVVLGVVFFRVVKRLQVNMRARVDQGSSQAHILWTVYLALRARDTGKRKSRRENISSYMSGLFPKKGSSEACYLSELMGVISTRCPMNSMYVPAPHGMRILWMRCRCSRNLCFIVKLKTRTGTRLSLCYKNM